MCSWNFDSYFVLCFFLLGWFGVYTQFLVVIIQPWMVKHIRRVMRGIKFPQRRD